MRNVLLTGGTGYIGSHTCVELAASGWTPIIVDNLCNSSDRVLERIERIAGCRPQFHHADLRDRAALDRIFEAQPIVAVVHFAGLKAVGESTIDPQRYYENNVSGSLVLLQAMRDHGVTNLVFSSSATVYGVGAKMPLTEDSPLGPVNPYGRTKLMVEQIISDVAAADRRWRVLLLRYFNPVGAHPSGLIGEDPAGIPNNLMPMVAQVAVGRRAQVSVFGDDYATPDGTGVRDYVHVVDLAAGHVAGLDRIFGGVGAATEVVNLGTGRGHSVLELIRAFERASNRPVPFTIAGRRPGDVDICYADVARAGKWLNWTARRGLEEMCADAWHWQQSNPTGFRD
jgi:UDP-glucose 4-epimerase